jgi:hypothetical protein
MSTRDKCHCAKRPKLSYLAAHADAEQRMKRGEKQVQCPVCKHWNWPRPAESETTT